MGEKEIIQQVRAILQNSGSKNWNYERHTELIANIAVEHGLPITLKDKFKAVLLIQGVGGNSSQFAQWFIRGGMPIERQRARREKLFDKFDE